MTFTYKPKGICASLITVEVEDNKVQTVDITGGCPGNHIGLDHLLRGMDVDEAIERMMGIKCGVKSSSCPEQVAMALAAMKEAQA